MTRTALVTGAGGFIGTHLVARLKRDGFFVRAADLKHPQFSSSQADEFVLGDLRDPVLCRTILNRPFDEVYQLAADMGGAAYIFTGDNDAEILHNSAQINLNMIDAAVRARVGRIFYSSSACIYPAYNQLTVDDPKTNEDSAYPADPDSDYGWEKLFSERLYLAYGRNKGLNVRIARYHNVFGPLGAFQDGREKAPAALCRKVAMARDGGEIEIWGDGEQTRSFLYVDECLEGTLRLTRSDWTGPVNIGSAEMISINSLARMIMTSAGKRLTLHHIPGPLGVRGRTSDNRLIAERLRWRPGAPLSDGIAKTYAWIAAQIRKGGEPAQD
jgi:GDP-D-mannose 3', 5'-epimerase